MYFAAIDLNQLWGFIAIAGVVIVGFVYLYSVGKRGRADIIRQDNVDLRASNQEMRTEKVGLEATIKEQQESIRYLKDVATQTPAVTKLLDMIGAQQTQNSQQHTEVISELSKLTGQISKLAGQFGTLAAALNESTKKEK